MNGHIEAVHESIKSYKILQCDASFSPSHGLKIHITAVHEGKELYECNVCIKHFSTKYQMNEHIASVHEGIKQYKCLQCDASFLKSQCLKKNILQQCMRTKSQISSMYVYNVMPPSLNLRV